MVCPSFVCTTMSVSTQSTTSFFPLVTVIVSPFPGFCFSRSMHSIFWRGRAHDQLIARGSSLISYEGLGTGWDESAEGIRRHEIGHGRQDCRVRTTMQSKDERITKNAQFPLVTSAVGGPAVLGRPRNPQQVPTGSRPPTPAIGKHLGAIQPLQAHSASTSSSH
jgi:hypothetical protein